MKDQKNMRKNKSTQKIHFKTIGIVGHPRHPEALSTHELIYNWLLSKNYNAIIDKQVAKDLNLQNANTGNLTEIGQLADLVIVVGGDGNMLGAARILSRYNNKVIGINRGNLGFLTDLDPDNALQQLSRVLEGEYHEEQRFLLEAQVIKPNQKARKSSAINEIVLHPGKVAHMIEFEVYIDDRFAFSQRSDGLIIATPTGSTAYSLSAGGPILMPNLDAIVLVPMFPHTLSSRPLVISSDSSIRLKFLRNNIDYEVSCDSQIMLPIQDGEEVVIKRSNKSLNLVHPKDYNYFNTLSSKLGWAKKLFNFFHLPLYCIKKQDTLYANTGVYFHRRAQMLTQLTINNFAIVRDLEIDFRSGMTTITGETGAGKSIAIDALGLCLGNRGETNMVRPGAQRADLCARFSLIDAEKATKWLISHELDNHNECLLRRTITIDGRSRGFINGTAVPLSQLRELGTLLIQIHGQHAHQLLLDNAHQKSLLDAYANQQDLLSQMKQSWQKWHDSCQQLAMFQKQMQERESRQQLLDYHLKELSEFSPIQGEFENIEQEYKQLANYGQFLMLGQNAMQILSDNDDANILSLLNIAKSELDELASLDTKFSSLLDMLEEASIQVSEVSEELRHYCGQYELDPNRLFELEQRISKQISLSRKHHITPEALPDLYQQLLDEQEKIASQSEDCEVLSEQVRADHQQAIVCAQTLHHIRLEYAQELSQLITNSMHQLSMPHGQFTIDIRFTPEHLQPDGACKVEFNVTTNPGQPHQALAKVASGGELSRIALAIQVITAKKMDTPALIFDEVDVGISGPTAAIVGKLLRELGESTQVMCVTHLPQVAGCGHYHFYVSKETNGIETETHMQLLDKKSRLQELARLLAGSEVTKNTLANAKELLAA